MRFIVYIIFLCFLASCSSGPKAKATDSNSGQGAGTDLNKVLDGVSCANVDDFRGIGIGRNENEAITQARSNMAQEYFVEKLKTIIDIEGQNINGVANTNTYTSISQNAKLLNPSDAKLHYSKRQGDQIGVVACMTKADAAKSFIEQQRQVADSLSLASSMSLNTEHPKHKNEAWHRTQMLHNDFMRIQNLLEGWGVKSPYSADEIYIKARENYKNYCQSVKVFWQDVKNNCSEAVFSILSQKIKFEKSKCSSGLNLSFYCSERCKSASFGIECSYDPSLAIESCGGEKYLMLKAPKPVTGGDMYNETKAREDLAKNLQNVTFFNEWEKEIKQWVPQCSD